MTAPDTVDQPITPLIAGRRPDKTLMVTDATSPLLEQGFTDCATALNGFGPEGAAVTPEDVAALFDRWLAIPEDQRHIAALCFMQFDSNREVFGAAAA